MRKISADWIVPVSGAPVPGGVVIVDDDGKIISVENREQFDKTGLEIHTGIICPGFINAHCHLELSYMHSKIPQHAGMAKFIIDLIDYRNGFRLAGESHYPEIIYDAIRRSEKEMQENGIVAVGDISNDTYTFEFKVNSSLKYHTFVECFGFYPDNAGKYFIQSLKIFQEARNKNLSASITPHAPYSVPPELFRLIFSFTENHPPIFSFHSQESKAENDFFETGSGDFTKVFGHFGLPLSIFQPTGKNSLQSVLPFFPVKKKLMLVHNTRSDSSDFKLAAGLNPETFFCTCPNANLYIQNSLPDYSHWKNYPDRICIGTDSLASNHQLSVLEEMKTIQRHDASVSTHQLVQWSTLNGAQFFGWDKELGSITPEKKPGLNLITDMDEEMKFTSASKVVKLI